MANVRPFRALYYNPRKVRHLENVFVPPYDVISEEERKQFFKKSPYNFARIILGKTAKDGYETVRKHFQAWQAQKILIEDPKEHFYFWEQKFSCHLTRVTRARRTRGHWISRKGIVAAVALDDFYSGKIRPHEKTLEAPKADRLEILKVCQANLSPVFMMYEDPHLTLEKEILENCQKPLMVMRDSNGVWNKIWKIEKGSLSHRIQEVLASKNLYIIDGHHRFATALRYQKEGSPSQKNNSQKFILSVITNMSDPALVIYPIYRALPKLSHFKKESYLKSLEKFFHVKKKKNFVSLKRGQWGIFFHRDPYFYELTCKNKASVLSHLKGSRVVKELDVALLQNVIIPQNTLPQLEYIKGGERALKMVLKNLHRGKYEVVWLVCAPTVQQVKCVADHKEIMPPKSTFFYPKLLSGPLIRRLAAF